MGKKLIETVHLVNIICADIATLFRSAIPWAYVFELFRKLKVSINQYNER